MHKKEKSICGGWPPQTSVNVLCCQYSLLISFPRTLQHRVHCSGLSCSWAFGRDVNVLRIFRNFAGKVAIFQHRRCFDLRQWFPNCASWIPGVQKLSFCNQDFTVNVNVRSMFHIWNAILILGSCSRPWKQTFRFPIADAESVGLRCSFLYLNCLPSTIIVIPNTGSYVPVVSVKFHVYICSDSHFTGFLTMWAFPRNADLYF